MVVPLDEKAWSQGESADDWPRSRYSGAALYPGQMAVSIIVSWQDLFGHAYIAFEWFADEVPGPRVCQRRHEIYHLQAEPTQAERDRGITDPGKLGLLSGTRTARVLFESDPQFFPIKTNGQSLPAYYRGWLVPFDDGWQARSAAAGAIGSAHQYNYFSVKGKNCARWVVEIASLAGIDAGHRLSSLVAIPKCLVSRVEPIEDEGLMWQRRKSAERFGSGSRQTSDATR